MLYLFHPYRQSRWVNHVDRELFEVALSSGSDLAALDWHPAERVLDDGTLRLALRYGHQSSLGLVVHVGDLVAYDRVKRIRDAHAESVALREHLRASNAQMEAVVPGWTAAQEAADVEVDDSIEQSLREAEADLNRALALPSDERLVAFWATLGGRLPDPE